MITTIQATFDGAVFRPVEPIALEANTTVRLTVETVSASPMKGTPFLETARALKLEGPPDWATNLDKYLYGEDSSRDQ